MLTVYSVYIVASILIETPILVVGLSKPHSLTRRLFAGVWLTACTYLRVPMTAPPALVRKTIYQAWLSRRSIALVSAAMAAGVAFAGAAMRKAH